MYVAKWWPSVAASLVAFITFPALACDLDSAASTHWSIARDGGKSFLVTPCGDRFFSVGVNVIDGGVTADTARLATAAGADVLVAGTAVFKREPDGSQDYADNITRLRG